MKKHAPILITPRPQPFSVAPGVKDPDQLLCTMGRLHLAKAKRHRTGQNNCKWPWMVESLFSVRFLRSNAFPGNQTLHK